MLAPLRPVLLQLASVFFILCGVHNDLLVVRFYIALAYIMITVNVIVNASQELSLDSLLFALLGLYIQGASLLALLRDEQPVRLSDDESALWRLLYRSGGLSARLFHSIVLPHLEVVQFEANQPIPTDEFFYILYTGFVSLKVIRLGETTPFLERVLQSGQMFDLRVLGLLSQREFIFQSEDPIICTSMTACNLFRFRRTDIKTIANHPFAKGVWRSLVINDLSISFERYVIASSSATIPVHECDRLFNELEEWEKAKSILPGSESALRHPLMHLFSSMKRSLVLPWPFGRQQAGLRQTLLPAPQARPNTKVFVAPMVSSDDSSTSHSQHMPNNFSTASHWTNLVRSSTVMKGTVPSPPPPGVSQSQNNCSHSSPAAEMDV